MFEIDKTEYFSAFRQGSAILPSSVTIFDGLETPKTYELNSFRKIKILFGRSPDNDIVLNSRLVSSFHGRFLFQNNCWYIEDRAVYSETASTNGLIFNNTQIRSKPLFDGDFIRIDNGTETIPKGVLFLFSLPNSANKWKTFSFSGKSAFFIGRNPECDIILPHISVSKTHAMITRENGKYYIADLDSTNGVTVNNEPIHEKKQLHEKDIITITNTRLIFTSAAIYFCSYTNGISVSTSHAVIRRGKGKKSFITGNNISVSIQPGELVAIVGGSGAGKSTVLNCMCGYLQPSKGAVYINGVDLYRNFDMLKRTIGYVPQSDIVYDNLTLHDMLAYTASLRLPRDITRGEKETAIERAIQLVELEEKKTASIKSLSGGQRKRASIAVELLSDPSLLFLDEPASGLDPGTERNLMKSLRTMADSGKTVILVTHSTLQLHLCDKIMFMGKGGNLCFFGTYQEALRFFRVSDIVDIYTLISDDPLEWREKYDAVTTDTKHLPSTSAKNGRPHRKGKLQLPILCARYAKLVINDRQRFFLLLAQAPLLALLISFVADGSQFEQYDMTKSLLFALSCSAFWVGMLNAIQEICKEKSILKREYMTGLSLSSYILSKIIVLGLLDLLQSILIVDVFAITVGLPETGLFTLPYIEISLTTFMTALASSAMGLFVSSLFTNPDRAMTIAPILLLPQILFSGLIFELSDASEIISWFAVCRWSMEGYGTTANLNSLPLMMQQKGFPVPHETESFFEFTKEHLATDWILLAAFTVAFLILSRISLSRLKQENTH